MNDTGGMVPSKGNRGFEAPTSKELLTALRLSILSMTQ